MLRPWLSMQDRAQAGAFIGITSQYVCLPDRSHWSRQEALTSRTPGGLVPYSLALVNRA